MARAQVRRGEPLRWTGTAEPEPPPALRPRSLQTPEVSRRSIISAPLTERTEAARLRRHRPTTMVATCLVATRRRVCRSRPPAMQEVERQAIRGGLVARRCRLPRLHPRRPGVGRPRRVRGARRRCWVRPCGQCPRPRLRRLLRRRALLRPARPQGWRVVVAHRARRRAAEPGRAQEAGRPPPVWAARPRV